MEKEEALKHLRDVFKWFQGQTQESLKTLLPEITETEDDKFKKAIRLVLIATEGDQRAFYSTHGITRKECTDWLEKRAVRDEKNVRKYIASLAFNLHAETDLPYGECVRFAIQLGEELLGVADGTVESGISDEDLEDFENDKCVRLAAAEVEAAKDKEHAEKFLKSAGIMDKDGGLAEPYRDDIELGLDRALMIVKDAKGVLPGYQSDDGIYECDHAIQVISDLLDSKVCKPAEWSYPYGKNETADRLVSLAECLEMDGDCLFNGCSGTECGKFLRELARKQIECKPAEWSKEDERILYNVIAYMGYAAGQTGVRDDLFKEANDWLEALRLKRKHEWSDHDREMRMKILKYLSTRCSVAEFEEVEDWLNGLRIPRYNGN